MDQCINQSMKVHLKNSKQNLNNDYVYNHINIMLTFEYCNVIVS